ncbi:hypothetical protein [Sanguibacter sp. HDW7]|uniref:hypothetical protein n=1 Tax=Sanguibacter sp. HDW7 TaxID=2714931 RepID=UPI00140E8465|nr:hypothetical protein [Sanguibacter sp. HDW7]QIK82464.1 hypothetical protein G7063_01660 [Sanguibacter sp. HDW7]
MTSDDGAAPEAAVPDVAGAGVVTTALPGRRARWLAVAGVLLLVAALAASVWWQARPRATPHVAVAGTTWPSAYVETEDPIDGELRYVLTDPGPDGTAYVFDIVNDGSSAVTVASHPTVDRPRDARRAGVVLTPLDAAGGTDAAGEPGPTIRLEPGEAAKLELRPLWECAPFVAGTLLGIDSVDVDVTAQGVTRTQTIALPVGLFLRTTVDLDPGPEWGC